MVIGFNVSVLCDVNRRKHARPCGQTSADEQPMEDPEALAAGRSETKSSSQTQPRRHQDKLKRRMAPRQVVEDSPRGVALRGPEDFPKMAGWIQA